MAETLNKPVKTSIVDVTVDACILGSFERIPTCAAFTLILLYRKWDKTQEGMEKEKIVSAFKFLYAKSSFNNAFRILIKRGLITKANSIYKITDEGRFIVEGLHK